ncbi:MULTISPECIES: ligase-associated DNA damage response DEXH box helicase [Rhodobacterales]|jgi:ATP-dependent Lhr-like helicase|uniref:ligase-associated DNA damage response DEXH box helicase n=1 Tax=Rhodobacterales TaxID=204455 RepID=UPI00237F25ED|nr:ligase-associated DNA damage response DEXH box helicase [Phaeobacter gallaeciensis]MDE4140528.1 ligase-associated DNA damage response DEXH box helicase [Phaeobacter gallaeciensis]MDE4148779.1 ligase-associated DNA damage response DEXH box helicase [Phaeobacter gallaeciensis]MDE4153001.1 ligase-associated DNA damage response DEXH box helicase [Phaeobacter gallaeciensis]MDE4228585.1 ligase-associated DNA damage response DEXH box helicase [Phaeobacter gallaeciensis]MDE4257661.1 ligase-associat
MDSTAALPPRILDWFSARGWSIHPHQQDMLDRATDPATLLIAPTGGGKTMAGFLPTLIELADGSHEGLHTLYVSPLKALAADIKRNLRTPVEEMGLPIRIDDRTGDTPQSRRKCQRADPPHILLTTPESLALMVSYGDAARTFGGLRRIVIDEIHALAESKRGDQLMLALARLQSLCPDLRRVGLSATVDDPAAIARYLARHPDPCDIVLADPGPAPDIAMLHTSEAPPWAGGGAAYAIPAVLEQIRAHQTTLIFHNTRAQAEIFFHNLWLANEDALPIAIHHGSLDRAQRERVEAAMVAGELRAVVCTGSLDLGIDWGNVDLVIQIGAPKNVKRLVQRIGRANHRYNAPSKALLVPANRFEVIECHAALEAVQAGRLDGDPRPPGPRDVLCQHILITACAGPFDADALFAEVISTGAYAALSRAEFDACLDFCATGGYALRAYDQWQRLLQRPDGLWQLRDPRAAARIRMNIGTIQDADLLKVRMKHSRGGKPLGEIEEAFAATLTPGDTFLIGGQIVRYESLREMTVEVSRDRGRKPKIAVFSGTKFATSTQLSQGILDLLARGHWPDLPAHTADWLDLQRQVSELPRAGQMLIESFPHQGREHTCLYGFAGRNAQQTLGLLVTKRMEELGLDPLGFVATDYATLIWGLAELTDPAPLLEADALRDGLERWLAENAVMKRAFRGAATIAGLIERNSPGARKSGRQATFSSDILYDTLRKYDPGHLLLDITRDEALSGLVDCARIEEMADRIRGRVTLRRLKRISPLAAPLLLEMGKVPVQGAGAQKLLEREAEELMRTSGLAELDP